MGAEEARLPARPPSGVEVGPPVLGWVGGQSVGWVVGWLVFKGAG